MMGKLLLAFLPFLVGLSVLADSNGQIPVVGLDSNGKSQVHYIPGASYIQAMTSAITAVNTSVLTSLKNQPATGSSWQLQTVGVGLGASIQFGLGPLGEVTLSPRVSLLFSDGSLINPVGGLGEKK